MRPFGLLFLVAVTCAATLAVSSHPAAQWRLEILRKKTTGDYAGFGWGEILSRISKVDPEDNGGRWVLGNGRL